MRRVKLDQNLGASLLHRARTILDAESVASQRRSGIDDTALFELCRSEQRTLITLDLDFSNPFRFPPAETSGTIVLRAHRPSSREIAELFDAAIARMSIEPIEGRIWIVEPGRVRLYPADVDEEEIR